MLWVQARKTKGTLEMQNNMLNRRMFLSSASGKKAFAFLAAEELKTTPPRIRNTYAGMLLSCWQCKDSKAQARRGLRVPRALLPSNKALTCIWPKFPSWVVPGSPELSSWKDSIPKLPRCSYVWAWIGETWLFGQAVIFKGSWDNVVPVSLGCSAGSIAPWLSALKVQPRCSFWWAPLFRRTFFFEIDWDITKRGNQLFPTLQRGKGTEKENLLNLYVFCLFKFKSL